MNLWKNYRDDNEDEIQEVDMEKINQYLEDCPSDCIRLFQNITAATNIVVEGLDSTFKSATDFGPSFYTTPDYNNALYWAMAKRYGQHGALCVRCAKTNF